MNSVYFSDVPQKVYLYYMWLTDLKTCGSLQLEFCCSVHTPSTDNSAVCLYRWMLDRLSQQRFVPLAPVWRMALWDTRPTSQWRPTAKQERSVRRLYRVVNRSGRYVSNTGWLTEALSSLVAHGAVQFSQFAEVQIHCIWCRN